MSPTITALVALALAAYSFRTGRARALALASASGLRLHSRPGLYGVYVAMWTVMPPALVMVLWLVAQPVVVEFLIMRGLPEAVGGLPADQLRRTMLEIANIAAGMRADDTADQALAAAAERLVSFHRIGWFAMIAAAAAAATIGFGHGRARITPAMRARVYVERMVMILFAIASTIAILTTLGIVLSLAFEAVRFFARVPFFEFLFGLEWSPQTAIREGQVGSSGAFGAVPVFAGTFLITVIAMLVAVPVGLMSAIYLSDYAAPSFRAWAKPALEILAGIPTVVYGVFAAITIGPSIRALGDVVGLSIASESALAAGLVMGIMIIPFISSLSDDVISAVPQSLRDGSLALGATKGETIKRVVVPAALPGIVGATLLAVSRAIGETMIVVMAAGLAANLTLNPFQAVTTVTVQIVTLLVGDQEFDSAKTLAAFALGLTLFVATLGLNIVALIMVRRYREQYE